MLEVVGAVEGRLAASGGGLFWFPPHFTDVRQRLTARHHHPGRGCELTGHSAAVCPSWLADGPAPEETRAAVGPHVLSLDGNVVQADPDAPGRQFWAVSLDQSVEKVVLLLGLHGGKMGEVPGAAGELVTEVLGDNVASGEPEVPVAVLSVCGPVWRTTRIGGHARQTHSDAQ